MIARENIRPAELQQMSNLILLGFLASLAAGLATGLPVFWLVLRSQAKLSRLHPLRWAIEVLGEAAHDQIVP